MQVAYIRDGLITRLDCHQYQETGSSKNPTFFRGGIRGVRTDIELLLRIQLLYELPGKKAWGTLIPITTTELSKLQLLKTPSDEFAFQKLIKIEKVKIDVKLTWKLI